MRYLWSIKWWASKVFVVWVCVFFWREFNCRIRWLMTTSVQQATRHNKQQKLHDVRNSRVQNRLQRWYSTTNINHSTEWWLPSIDWILKARRTHTLIHLPETVVARCLPLQNAISFWFSFLWCFQILDSKTYCVYIGKKVEILNK